MVFIFWRKPSALTVNLIAKESQGSDKFNYDQVGATSNESDFDLIVKSGSWNIDRKRVKVGQGIEDFNRACLLIKNWEQFQLGWAEVNRSTPVKHNAPVVVVAKSLFLWTANPLRIVYVDDCKAPARKAGNKTVSGPSAYLRFAHGCLPGHLLAGEERFSVELGSQQGDDSVWYDITTFSRPAHALSLITYPLVRFYQAKFAEDSAARMTHLMAGSQPLKV